MQEYIKAKIENRYQYQANESFEEMEKLWIEYKETVIQGAEETCGHKTTGGPSKRTAWWNDEVKQKS